MIIKDSIGVDYSRVLSFLNSGLGRIAVAPAYYTRVNHWLELYKDEVSTFHSIHTHNGINSVVRKMNRLHMGKRVCEDWASSLLNERVDIVISSAGSKTSSSIYIQGSKGDGGVLGSSNFNVRLSEYIEYMFALGSSAIVIDINDIALDGAGNIVDGSKGSVDINFYSAPYIIPISSKNGQVTECSFLSVQRVKDKPVYVLSTHVKEDGLYVVYNNILNEDYKSTDLPQNVAPCIRTGSDKPLFQIIKPAIADSTDLVSCMGVSILDTSGDVVLAVDSIYDASIREIETGQRLVFMSTKLLPMTEDGKPIPPQDIKKSYFALVGEPLGGADEETLFKCETPELRCDAIDKELQNQLNMLSNNCGLGTKYYQFSDGVVTTATEYTGSRNDFMRNAKKHSHMLESAIKSLVVQLLWVGKNVLGKNVNPSSKVVVTVADGIIVDDSVDKASDRQDVLDGIMSKAEYRSKWYGESLEDAQAVIDSIEGKEDNPEVVIDSSGV